MEPLLGWIPPSQHTPAQAEAHAKAQSQMLKFTLQPVKNTGPVKVDLTELWGDPDIVADIGRKFPGFRQLTGSCVGASGGNAIATLGFVQRKFADNPTKAFIPWWPFAYGRTRFNEGDRGQGEGAVDSVMGQTLKDEGVLAATEAGLPTFDDSDGLALTTHIEYQWSAGGTDLVEHYLPIAKKSLLGGLAPLSSPDDIKTSILHACPVLDGCNNFVGHGSIKGEGKNAYARGRYDGRGGHSTCFLGYWDHPDDGPLFKYSNQWDASTYPIIPGEAGRCCVWLPLSEVEKLFNTGGSDGETMALSHLNYIPAIVDKVLDFSQGM